METEQLLTYGALRRQGVRAVRARIITTLCAWLDAECGAGRVRVTRERMDDGENLFVFEPERADAATLRAWRASVRKHGLWLYTAEISVDGQWLYAGQAGEVIGALTPAQRADLAADARGAFDAWERREALRATWQDPVICPCGEACTLPREHRVRR